ncbi:ArsR/SmtB family transcription factor [Methanosphaera cuniculi]|uniref:HTH arsR-type domain-containing protein n=1 Tax=Methanosphaera cuniculi TaxID=1077256 RepID=A0A2A2HCT4_9EURY|nr:hypothetical protein [Methanosphaera cuniculi]PAV07185.1 hypothetical protein ASJ82_05805 [Methanosphaera cuniculi]PWL07641.1 hypothetical protein MSCUN_15150 [Methanosphaera cuniculi]
METKTEKKLEKTFKILSNTNRLKIISLLAKGKKEITVNEIAEKKNNTTCSITTSKSTTNCRVNKIRQERQ